MHDLTKMMFEAIIEQVPSKVSPSLDQENIMNKDNSGIAIVHNKGAIKFQTHQIRLHKINY